MRKSTIILLVCLSSVGLKAQNNNDDFQNFRKGMLEGYYGFRKSVLDDYSKFLNGIWEDYEVFAGKKSNPEPKPEMQPIVKADAPKPVPVEIEPEEVKPTEPIVEQEIPQLKPIVVPVTEFVSFDWCGMSFELPEVTVKGKLSGVEKSDLVEFFELLQVSNIDKEVIPLLKNIVNTANLNDWCQYLLIESYVKRIMTNTNANTRNMVCWYMMAKLGYDIRLTLNGNSLFYLIPFQQQIYARSYLMINNSPYYIYGEGSADNRVGFYTPTIPDVTGKYVNGVLSRPLNIQYKAKKFTHSFSGCTLSVEVNENLIKIMSQFPQMPIPVYAISEGDSKARKQLLNQMNQFIKGKSEIDAANFILKFIQSFKYATDDEQFGYEKPFFVEESLFYPKCDCEDRAILYHYLVSQLLGRDVHLLHYPNHECAAVNFSKDLNADSYIYKGKQYVICDPTYIGASIGMCMPDFRNIKPEVELVKCSYE